MPPPERLPGCLAKGNASRPVENRSSDSTNMIAGYWLASSFEKKGTSSASPPQKSTPGGRVNPEADNSTAGPHFTRALVAKQRQRHLAWGSPWSYYSVTSLPTRATKLYMRSQVQDQCLPAHMACDTPKVKCLSELTGAQLHLGSLSSAKSPLTGQTTTAPPLICRQTAPIQRGTPPSVSEPHTDKATATMPGESCVGGHAQERVSPYRGGRTPLYGRHCKFYAFIPSL